MITKDYHGWFPSNAENDVHITVGMVRKWGKRETAEFIVGNGGPVRTGVIRALEDLGLEPKTTLGNAGSITVTIE